MNGKSNTGLIIGGTLLVGTVATILIATRKKNGGNGGEEPVGEAYVSGHVTAIQSSIPIPSVLADATVEIAGRSAVSDENGYYQIVQAIPSGAVTVRLNADGWQPYEIQAYLVPGQNTLNIEMVSPNQYKATLAGFITDGSGAPLPGALISFYLPGQSTVFETYTADQYGFFQRLQVNTGLNLTWKASKPGYAPKEGSLTTVAGINMVNVTLEAGNTWGPAFTFGQITGSVYSDPSLPMLTIPRISVPIMNNSGQAARHKLVVLCDYYTYAQGQTYDDVYLGGSERFLDLAPGQSYVYNYDGLDARGQPGAICVFYQSYADIWVQDELGNRSGSIRLGG